MTGNSAFESTRCVLKPLLPNRENMDYGRGNSVNIRRCGNDGDSSIPLAALEARRFQQGPDSAGLLNLGSSLYSCFDVSSDGRLLAAVGGSMISIWNTETLEHDISRRVEIESISDSTIGGSTVDIQALTSVSVAGSEVRYYIAVSSATHVVLFSHRIDTNLKSTIGSVVHRNSHASADQLRELFIDDYTKSEQLACVVAARHLPESSWIELLVGMTHGLIRYVRVPIQSGTNHPRSGSIPVQSGSVHSHSGSVHAHSGSVHSHTGMSFWAERDLTECGHCDLPGMGLGNSVYVSHIAYINSTSFAAVTSLGNIYVWDLRFPNRPIWVSQPAATRSWPRGLAVVKSSGQESLSKRKVELTPRITRNRAKSQEEVVPKEVEMNIDDGADSNCYSDSVSGQPSYNYSICVSFDNCLFLLDYSDTQQILGGSHLLPSDLRVGPKEVSGQIACTSVAARHDGVCIYGSFSSGAVVEVDLAQKNAKGARDVSWLRRIALFGIQAPEGNKGRGIEGTRIPPRDPLLSRLLYTGKPLTIDSKSGHATDEQFRLVLSSLVSSEYGLTGTGSAISGSATIHQPDTIHVWSRDGGPPPIEPYVERRGKWARGVARSPIQKAKPKPAKKSVEPPAFEFHPDQLDSQATGSLIPLEVLLIKTAGGRLFSLVSAGIVCIQEIE